MYDAVLIETVPDTSWHYKRQQVNASALKLTTSEMKATFTH